MHFKLKIATPGEEADRTLFLKVFSYFSALVSYFSRKINWNYDCVKQMFHVFKNLIGVLLKIHCKLLAIKKETNSISLSEKRCSKSLKKNNNFQIFFKKLKSYKFNYSGVVFDCLLKQNQRNFF